MERESKKKMIVGVCLALTFGAYVPTALAEDVKPEGSENARTEYLDAASWNGRQEKWASMTPEQKTAVWVEKLNEVLALDWTAEEHDHIMILKNKIESGNIYADIASENDEAQNWIESWAEEGMKEFGWSKSVVYAIAGTLEPMLSTDGKIDSKMLR